MRRRLVVGPVLIAALVGIYLLDAFVFGRATVSRVLLWLVALAAFGEVIALGRARVETNPGLFLYGALAMVAAVAPWVAIGRPVPGILVALAALLGGGIRLLGMSPLRSAAAALPEAMLLAGGLLYTAGLLLFLDRLFVESVATGFAVVAVSKSSDIAGYLVGTLVGRKRIAPAISPKKSWEGSIAGVLASAGVARLLAPELAGPPWYAALLGAAIGAASLFGDLLESGFKRWAGAKDSAALLPEFGGFLDMVDGVLVAAPIAVLLLFKT